VIRLPDLVLPVAARRQLRRWQAEIDDLAAYADRVSEAERRFELRNRAENPTFKGVRDGLDRTCSGGRRCAYCEDSAADEVEHVKPKALYPEACFRPENYVYGCGPCNGPKRNHLPSSSPVRTRAPSWSSGGAEGIPSCLPPPAIPYS
jgi:5-methylcytosine-specific restriction endonuclease McrA